MWHCAVEIETRPCPLRNQQYGEEGPRWSHVVQKIEACGRQKAAVSQGEGSVKLGFVPIKCRQRKGDRTELKLRRRIPGTLALVACPCGCHFVGQALHWPWSEWSCPGVHISTNSNVANGVTTHATAATMPQIKVKANVQAMLKVKGKGTVRITGGSQRDEWMGSPRVDSEGTP